MNKGIIIFSIATLLVLAVLIANGQETTETIIDPLVNDKPTPDFTPTPDYTPGPLGTFTNQTIQKYLVKYRVISPIRTTHKEIIYQTYSAQRAQQLAEQKARLENPSLNTTIIIDSVTPYNDFGRNRS